MATACGFGIVLCYLEKKREREGYSKARDRIDKISLYINIFQNKSIGTKTTRAGATIRHMSASKRQCRVRHKKISGEMHRRQTKK